MRRLLQESRSKPTLYKFCAPSPYSFSNLERGILYCRHFTDFNDPFEFWSNVSTGVPTTAEPERLAHAIRTWGFEDGSIPSDLVDDANDYFQSLEEAQPDFDALFNHTRICCFSSDPKNLLMWSHYADGLRGFCIGFDEEDLMEATDRRYDFLTGVEYIDEPPSVDSFIYAVAEDQFDYHMTEIEETATQIKHAGKSETWPDEQDDYRRAADEALDIMHVLLRRAFASKPREWEYERESRLLIRTELSDRLPVELPYRRQSVRQLIVGERMNSEFRNTLERLVVQYYPHADLLEARRSQERFTLSLGALAID